MGLAIAVRTAGRGFNGAALQPPWNMDLYLDLQSAQNHGIYPKMKGMWALVLDTLEVQVMTWGWPNCGGDQRPRDFNPKGTLKPFVGTRMRYLPKTITTNIESLSTLCFGTLDPQDYDHIDANLGFRNPALNGNCNSASNVVSFRSLARIIFYHTGPNLKGPGQLQAFLRHQAGCLEGWGPMILKVPQL